MLRAQLLRWLLVPLFVLLMVDAFVTYGVAWNFSRRAYDRSLLDIAHEITLHLGVRGDTLVLDLSEQARQVLLGDPHDRIAFEVADSEGRLVAGEPIAPPDGERARPGGGRFYEARAGGEPVRVIELPVDADPASGRPAALVRVAETEHRRGELAREILLSVILPQALLIVVAGAVVWMGVVHGLAPLERLRRAVMARAQHDSSPVATDDVPGEVRPLLDSINELVARLDAALTLQNRFITDAAHQLKTPIAVLENQLELASREQDPEAKNRALRDAHSGLERLARVVSQLLSLARNEPEGAGNVVLVPLDLRAIALEAATDWVPQALKKNIDLGFEAGAGEIPVRGDASRLRELLDNMIDNAVRYTPSGGRVTVRVAPGPPAPFVEISDDGPRIPPGERQRVFERFHRLLGSVQGGSGLGLAISREIARIHGAAIDLRDDADGTGNTFSITFPAA